MKKKKKNGKGMRNKIDAILANYHIENTVANFNSITMALLSGKNVDIYKMIIKLADYCIITDENEESFTSEILVYKNSRLLEDIQTLFVTSIIGSSSAEFRTNLFLRIKIYKNIRKCR